jgi:hypothetical protein
LGNLLAVLLTPRTMFWQKRSHLMLSSGGIGSIRLS